MGYTSIEEMCENAQKNNVELWEYICDVQAAEEQMPKEQIRQKMEQMYDAMRTANEEYDGTCISRSGLVGRDGQKLEEAVKNNTMICGDFIGKAMTTAVKMAESNACMKRIVAAPTAGSCGVIPAVFLTYEKEYEIEKERMIQALFVAAGVGSVIAQRASLAGASGGCQAEVGSASAMAAAAITYLRGGDAGKIADSVSIAIANLLGLVCDPVAGLVELPCVKRNVIGTVNALTSSDMVMAGMHCIIPADQMIDAMKKVGDSMPSELKETGKGGMAATPKAKIITKEILQK